jgi:hypothetical protein
MLGEWLLLEFYVYVMVVMVLMVVMGWWDGGMEGELLENLWFYVDVDGLAWRKFRVARE